MLIIANKKVNPATESVNKPLIVQHLETFDQIDTVNLKSIIENDLNGANALKLQEVFDLLSKKDNLGKNDKASADLKAIFLKICAESFKEIDPNLNKIDLGSDDFVEAFKKKSDRNKNYGNQLIKTLITSLSNDIFHEKSSNIIDNFPPQLFRAETIIDIQHSINFLSDSIKLLISQGNDQEALSKFNLLVKVLKIYGDKFNTQANNITLYLPENLAKTLQEMKQFEEGLLPRREDKIHLTPQDTHATSETIAPILKTDIYNEVHKQLILTSLKKESVTPENSPRGNAPENSPRGTGIAGRLNSLRNGCSIS